MLESNVICCDFIIFLPFQSKTEFTFGFARPHVKQQPNDNDNVEESRKFQHAIIIACSVAKF